MTDDNRAILTRLSSSQGQRDERLNILLAEELSACEDREAIAYLAGSLHRESKDIQFDIIKVLYEVGALNPSLIISHLPAFVKLLANKHNRLQWGAMMAISAISTNHPELVIEFLPDIMTASDRGSVITRDHYVRMLCNMMVLKNERAHIFQLLVDQLQTAPENQLPMYAELAAPVIARGERSIFIDLLRERLEDIGKESKRRRIENVIANQRENER